MDGEERKERDLFLKDLFCFYKTIFFSPSLEILVSSKKKKENLILAFKILI